MNRKFKVVWSRAKHCYTVASELAKGHTKGSGARSLRRAAVTFGVAAFLTGCVCSPAAHAKSPDTVNGVTFEYTDDGAVSSVSFGEMDFGTGRDASGAWYAGAAENIDTSGLHFKDPLAIEAGSEMDLVSNFSGIPEDLKRDIPYIESIGIEMTNGVECNGKYGGGVVSRHGSIVYEFGGTELTMDLGLWNGNTDDTTLTSWAKPGKLSIHALEINISDMKAGDIKTILDAGAAGFFEGATVSESTKWAWSRSLDKTPVNGVSVKGTASNGGVKADDTYQKLIYQQSSNKITELTLGEVAFSNGSTARKFCPADDLTEAEIDAGNLSFTSAMTPGESMVIVDASDAVKDGDGHALAEFADREYKTAFDDTVTDNLQLAGNRTDLLEQDDSRTRLTYTVGEKLVENAAMKGGIAWKEGGSHYTNTDYTFDANTAIDLSALTFTADTDPMNRSMTLIKNANGTVTGSPSKFTLALALGNTELTAAAEGNAAITGGNLEYAVTGVTLEKVTVSGTGSDALPDGWVTAENVTVDTGSMTVPADVAAGGEKAILTADKENTFTEYNITVAGENAYQEKSFETADKEKRVVVSGIQGKGVKASADGTSLVYAVSKKEADGVSIGSVTWKPDTVLLDGSSAEYDYSAVKALNTDKFKMTCENPETVAAGESMTLLQANETLADLAGQTRKNTYNYKPVSGVTVRASITGSLAAKDGAVTYTADENRASKLTFGDVEWKDSGALMTRPSNIIFAGADVDTAKIHFTNIEELEAKKKMTLVSDFGDSVGTITGSKYTVGTGLEGEGAASLSGSDLIFTAKTGAGNLEPREQTHKTVMAMEAGMALLASGNEFVGKTMDGLADFGNQGPDGAATFAAVGGGASRYETGSHVNTHSWNAVVGVGSTKELKNGSFEWGVFGEYGKGSYSLHSDAGRGDGDAHYAGGGVLAKWTGKNDVYTEASFRLGRLKDSASNLLFDGAGKGYGYDVHANYYGAHAGVGKVFRYDGGKSLDVYGKYIYTRRNGVDYNAGGEYSLDSVTGSVLRIGARYGTTDKRWNWYGGLAYEYEFDGEATGTVEGKAIRAASVQGSSVRGELGVRMNATRTNPWQTDISLYGYGGKHRGIGGNVNVTYFF